MLLHPIWLFLAIPLALSLWLWRMPSRLLLILRALTLILLLLALCGTVLRLPSQAGTIVVVADRSQSMPPGSETAQKEAIDLLQKAMGPDDRLAVVAFGRTAAVEQPPATGQFAGFVHEVGDDASNLADALETALALVPRDAPGKVFVLSDGRWSGRDPVLLAAQAAARNLAIDYRPLQRSTANDLAIARIEAPPSVTPGESFLLTAWVRSPIAQTVSFELRRDDQRLASGEKALVVRPQPPDLPRPCRRSGHAVLHTDRAGQRRRSGAREQSRPPARRRRRSSAPVARHRGEIVGAGETPASGPAAGQGAAPRSMSLVARRVVEIFRRVAGELAGGKDRRLRDGHPRRVGA